VILSICKVVTIERITYLDYRYVVHLPASDILWDLQIRQVRCDVLAGKRVVTHVALARKISWDLREANINEADGSVSQVYIRKHDDPRWKMPDGRAMSNRDGVFEVV
jgi:hypothetical protein